MAKTKAEETKFPRGDMDYNDRFKMTVKEFGRVILIELNRGKAKVSKDGKTVTITYNDSKTRKSSGKDSDKT
jgi:hypothetical protein